MYSHKQSIIFLLQLIISASLAPRVYFPASIGGCPSLEADYISRSGIVADSANCVKLGGDVSGSLCNLDWCVVDVILPDALYVR